MLEAEAGDSSGTLRKGNVRRWKPLPGNGSEDVIVNIFFIASGAGLSPLYCGHFWSIVP
jgi:hypothetical protein